MLLCCNACYSSPCLIPTYLRVSFTFSRPHYTSRSPCIHASLSSRLLCAPRHSYLCDATLTAHLHSSTMISHLNTYRTPPELQPPPRYVCNVLTDLQSIISPSNMSLHFSAPLEPHSFVLPCMYEYISTSELQSARPSKLNAFKPLSRHSYNVFNKAQHLHASIFCMPVTRIPTSLFPPLHICTFATRVYSSIP